MSRSRREDRARITKTVVDAQRADPGEDRTVWDRDLRGFGLRVWTPRAGGATRKAYVIRYGTGRRGRGRTVTIGQHGAPYRPDPVTGAGRTLTAELARSEAIRLLGARLDGRDPAEARDAQRSVPTLAEFAPRFLEVLRAKGRAPRTLVEYGRMIEGHLVPALGGRRLDSIAGADVERLHARLAGRRRTANLVVGVLSSLLSRARRMGALPAGHVNPCLDVERYPDGRRERHLSPAELAAVGKALQAEATRAPVAVALLRILMLTGARPTEIRTLRRDQLDPVHGLAMQVAKRGADGKPRGLRPIYFPQAALDAVASVPAVAGNPHVFPGRVATEPISNEALRLSWGRVRDAAKVPDVRIYDLRHTFASMAAAGGKSLPMIGALLGHQRAATTQRYAHLAADPVRAAGAAVAAAIEAAMTKSEDD